MTSKVTLIAIYTIAFFVAISIPSADANRQRFTKEHHQRLDAIQEEYRAKPHSSYQHSRHWRLLQTTSFNYSQSGADWTGTCSTGSLQSPVNIESIRGTCDNTMMFDLVLNNTALIVEVDNTNTTLQLTGMTGTLGTLYATDVDGNLYGYNCNQINFKAPSEHTIESTQYDAELQIVCTINAGFVPGVRTTAIVSVLWTIDDSAGDNAFISAIPTTANSTNITMNMNTSLYLQLAQPVVYYSYSGSYTAPPCTEIVNWYVVESPLTFTSAQAALFNRLWADNPHFAGGNGNNRPIQATNDRTVKKGGIACEEQFVYFFSFFILYVFINYFIFKLL